MASEPISFLDPKVQRCPFPAYAEVRKDGPVYFDASCGWYIVTGYDEIRKIGADAATFSSLTGVINVKEGPEADQINQIYKDEGILPVYSLVSSDPPLHTFHRSLVDKVFTVSRVKKMQAYIETVVQEMIGEFIADGKAEFVSQFAMKVPNYIIADQLGAPRSKFADFKRWSDAVIQEGDPSNSYEQKVAITRTICELQNFIIEMSDKYRKEPADCMLNDLLQAEDDGRYLEKDELVSIVLQILVAGNDTTTGAIASGMYRLIKTPGLEQSLRNDPSLIGNFVEEVLRYDSPIQGLWRRATCDTRVGDTDIPEGALLVLKFGAANRDPAQFPDPEALDPARKNARNHMAFGSGPHFCIGNQLARSELRTAFTMVLAQMKNFRLARGEEGVKFIEHFFGYGVHHLEIEFDRV